MRNLPQRRHPVRLCLLLGLGCILAGCADQSSSFATNADGALGATAQIVSDLTFLFR